MRICVSPTMVVCSFTAAPHKVSWLTPRCRLCLIVVYPSSPLCILPTVQVRYQNVLSSVVTPRARSISISDPSTLALQRRGLTPSRSKLFSYFSNPNSAPPSPTRSTPSSSRTALGESTDAPKFRPGSWSDDTVQHLTEQTKPYRTISPTAYKVLDAPELEVSPSYVGRSSHTDPCPKLG